MPPLLFRAAQKLRHSRRATETFVFEGNYPSLDSILRESNSYDDKDFVNRVVQSRLRNFEVQHASRNVRDNNGNWILPIVAAQYAGNPFTVLDFGCGPCVGIESFLNFGLKDL